MLTAGRFSTRVFWGSRIAMVQTGGLLGPLVWLILHCGSWAVLIWDVVILIVTTLTWGFSRLHCDLYFYILILKTFIYPSMAYLSPTWMIVLMCPKLSRNISGQGFHSDSCHCKTVSNSVCLFEWATVPEEGGLQIGQLWYLSVLHMVVKNVFEHTVINFFLAIMLITYCTSIYMLLPKTNKIFSQNKGLKHLTLTDVPSYVVESIFCSDLATVQKTEWKQTLSKAKGHNCSHVCLVPLFFIIF